MEQHPTPDAPASAHAVAHRPRGPAVWARAREEYEDGEPAPGICRRYGIGLSTFRERAAREGWRRRDADELTPADAERLDALGDVEEGPHALTLCWGRFALAVRDGDRLGARAWLRLHRELRGEMRELLEDIELDEAYSRSASGHLDAEDAAPPPSTPVEAADDPAEGTGTPPPAYVPTPPAPPPPDDLDDLDGVLRGGARTPAQRRLKTAAFRLRAAVINGEVPGREALAQFAAFRAASATGPMPPTTGPP